MAGHIEDSSSADWCTPPEIIQPVVDVLGTIELDPCSNPFSYVPAQRKYTLPDNDGLVDSWDFKTIFVNPPYGRCYMHKLTRDILLPKDFRAIDKKERGNWRSASIYDWVKRCVDANQLYHSQVIALVPASVDTKHWQNLIFPTATSVAFLSGRVKFVLPPDASGVRKRGPAPMACAAVYWGGAASRFAEIFNTSGTVLRCQPDLLCGNPL